MGVREWGAGRNCMICGPRKTGLSYRYSHRPSCIPRLLWPAVAVRSISNSLRNCFFCLEHLVVACVEIISTEGRGRLHFSLRPHSRKSSHGSTVTPERVAAPADSAISSYAYCPADCIKTFLAMIHRACVVLGPLRLFRGQENLNSEVLVLLIPPGTFGIRYAS